MNRSVALSMQASMLVTCCYVSVSPEEGVIRYTNAGHNPPYLVSGADGDISQLDSTDLLLGVPGFEDRDFKSARIDWSQGDVLALYSDGITEATDSGGEMFEEDRLQQVLHQNRKKSAPEIKQAILESLIVFSGGNQQVDDVTLVVVRAL
jgi:sigma-B regulation protein RsbU (phosphoserine phosphatase)